jgi:hypothetical protein
MTLRFFFSSSHHSSRLNNLPLHKKTNFSWNIPCLPESFYCEITLITFFPLLFFCRSFTYIYNWINGVCVRGFNIFSPVNINVNIQIIYFLQFIKFIFFLEGIVFVWFKTKDYIDINAFVTYALVHMESAFFFSSSSVFLVCKSVY